MNARKQKKQASKVLTDEEFHRQALAGGASRSLSASTVPDRGFMVGGARDLSNQAYPEISHPVDSFSLDDVRHHARDIRDRFGDSDPSVHQGAWVENNRVVLDASNRINDYHQAVAIAAQRGERAIYGNRRGEEIATKDAIPAPVKGG